VLYYKNKKSVLGYGKDVYKEMISMLVSADKKWDYALGMIKIDGLEPSAEMKKLIEKEKHGEMSMDDVKIALDRKYKMKQ
ncbi:MAG: antitoxin VbhA family protein, partial [Lachnospiraceae bacterium]|nr:antitoxin VbhA family protein [Lachnospiraceae bacterium]